MGRNEDGPECGEEAALHGGMDVGPDLQRAQPRHEGTLEVLVDASFSPGDGHSVSGTIILLAGCPVQWESKKQGFIHRTTRAHGHCGGVAVREIGEGIGGIAHGQRRPGALQ